MSKVLKPFVGLDCYRLLESTDTIKNLLQSNGEDYSEEIWPNKELTNPVPWTVIETSTHISFFFANDKLFKIYVEDNNDFILENGIYIGMPMREAKRIDSDLEYDDWNEEWSSPNGYWLEDNIDTDSVSTITVFIKEVLDEEEFDKYKW